MKQLISALHEQAMHKVASDIDELDAAEEELEKAKAGGEKLQ